MAYPDAIWPGHAADALRALIHAANEARDRVWPRPRPTRPLLTCDFSSAVLVGLQEVRHVPGANRRQRTGRLRSEAATRDRYAIRGYASTAVKHSTDALTAIHDALAGNPWIPPTREIA